MKGKLVRHDSDANDANICHFAHSVNLSSSMFEHAFSRVRTKCVASLDHRKENSPRLT